MKGQQHRFRISLEILNTISIVHYIRDGEKEIALSSKAIFGNTGWTEVNNMSWLS